MVSNWVALGMMDVARPFGRIRVRTGTQPREQRELKMIVRIDQARQDLKTAEVQIDALDLLARAANWLALLRNG